MGTRHPKQLILAFCVAVLCALLTVTSKIPVVFAAPPDGAVQCPTHFALLGTTPAPVPSVIERWVDVPLVEKVIELERLKSAVTIISPSSPPSGALRKLEPGTYVYVIDKQGRIAIASRAIDPGPDAIETAGATFLGSHEGLVRMLENPTASPGAIAARVEVVSAGEIVIRDGRVMAVSNGSGTYRGSGEHLRYGVGRLHAAGVDIDGRTQFLDYSTGQIPTPHATVPAQVREELKLLRDPKFKNLVQDFRNSITALDRRYPVQSDLARSFMQAPTPENRNLYFRAAMFVAQWQQPLESEVVALHRAIERFGEADVRNMLTVIEQMANTAH